MARRKASKRPKGPRPPRRVLALRKRARKEGRLIDYHGTSVMAMPESKRRREYMQTVRDWQGKKRTAERHV